MCTAKSCGNLSPSDRRLSTFCGRPFRIRFIPFTPLQLLKRIRAPRLGRTILVVFAREIEKPSGRFGHTVFFLALGFSNRSVLLTPQFQRLVTLQWRDSENGLGTVPVAHGANETRGRAGRQGRLK